MNAPRERLYNPKVFTVFDTFYTVAGAAAALGAIPWGWVRSAADPVQRARYWGRLGFIENEGLDVRPPLLFHGVSVGEVKLVAPLLAVAKARGLDVNAVVSATTPAGIAEAARLYPALSRAVFPSEFPGCAARFLDGLRPRAIALLEVELWPSFLRAAALRDLPVMILNGRISDRSANRYRLLLEYTARRLGGIAFFAMQNQEYAERIVKLGADPANVAVCGNVKFDGLPDPAERENPMLTRLLGLTDANPATSPILVAGSTHDPEERILAAVVKRLRAEGFLGLRLVLVPRHVDRADALDADLTPILGAPLRWSAVKTSGVPISEPSRPLVVDTVGELASFYRVATVAFVGGSLQNRRGGQNMLEPAALGVPLLHGPEVSNFRDAAACLAAARGSIVVHDEAGLFHGLGRLLRAPAEARSQASRALAALAPHRGAASRTLDEILKRPILAVR